MVSQAGWSVTKAGVLLTTDPPTDDSLENDYQKSVEGYKLALQVSCRVYAPAGDGYGLYSIWRSWYHSCWLRVS